MKIRTTTAFIRTSWKRLAAQALLLSAVVLAAPRAEAETVTWDGSTDMTWTALQDATSWGGATDDGDDAQFLGAGLGTVTIAGPVLPLSTTGVYLYTGTTNNLDFAGTQTIHELYVNDALLPAGVYGRNNLPAWFDGTGYLKSTLPRVFGGMPLIVR